MRVLSIWGEVIETREILYPRVYVPPVEVDDLFDDFFLPVARDGVGAVEVQVRLHKALAALERVRSALDMTSDVARVEAAAAAIV